MEEGYMTQCSNCGISLGGPCVIGALCHNCRHKQCDWCHRVDPHGLTEWVDEKFDPEVHDFVTFPVHICSACMVNQVAHLWA